MTQQDPFVDCLLGEHKPWCLLASLINDHAVLSREPLLRKADASSTLGMGALIQSSCCRRAP